MKHLILSSLILSAGLMISCNESKGPKGNIYNNDRSVEEEITNTLDAAEGDGWSYVYDVDLHKYNNGAWINVGKFSIYRILSDNDECNLWVEFDRSANRVPVYLTTEGGYNFRVKWNGEYYYF